MEPKISRINLLNSSMRQENSLFLVDRISALPDSILGIILSHLPTKNAVATTILSKRWKFVWMIVHNLDFCLEDSRNELPEEEDMKFVQFVNRVLLLLDGGLLNKFRLVWGPRFIPSQVSTWISIAITRNVHHLFVSVRNFDPNFYEVFDNFEALEMPVSVVNSDSLQCLELNVNISVSAAIVVCLPRLKSLKLVSVYFKSEEAFEQLICGCPKLNYLHLHINIDKMTSDDFRYIISSTSLRRLELHVGYSESDCPPSLQLKASSLEYFELVGRISQVFVQGCLSSLVEADFSIRFRQDVYDVYSEDICNSFVKAVRAFDCAKSLTLSMHAMWALDNATIGLSTKFTILTKLEAGVLCIYCRSLRDFIQSSDSLEVLTIEQECGSLEASDDEYSDWTAPVEVPRCLSNNLKAVAIKGYYGYDDEREMIGYMLKHGSALEVMQVTCHAYCTKRKNCELVKEIRRFPRKSPACKVEFIGCAWEIRAEAAEHGASVTPYLHEMCVRGQFLQFS